MLMPFPSAPESGASAERSCAVIDLDKDIESLCPNRPDTMDSVAIVDHVFATALEQQQPCLWLDAAALTTSDGRILLLAGASGAGKTTLALSLAMVCGWRVLSEDITLVDTSTRRVIPLARPFRLRPDSQARITEATAKKAAPLVLGRWFFDKSLFSQEKRIFAVSVAVLMRPAGQRPAPGLTLRELPASEYLRSILPISNAVRMPGGIEVLQDGVKQARCFELSGGSLKERLEAVRGSFAVEPVEWSCR